jgi:hypothetical protein
MAWWTARPVKLAATALGAIAAAGGAAALVRPPHLTPVAVLKVPVTAFEPVPAQDVTWVPMAHPPKGTVTVWAGAPLAAVPLPAGTVLTQADFAPAVRATALGPGEARYVVPITAASGVIPLGSRVDVWTAPGAGATPPRELAAGVRLIGLYTAQGQPIGPTPTGGFLGTTSAPSTPGLAALAVPAAALPALIPANPGQTVLLVADPTETHFTLTAVRPAPAPAAPKPAPAPKTQP